jgi:hypothetical protein
MNKYILAPILVLVSLIGCQTPDKPGELPPYEGDLLYLMNADPSTVTSAELADQVAAAEARVLAHNVVEGIYWQAIRYGADAAAPPNAYGLGGDSMLFTGKYLAACAYKYGFTRDSADLDRAIEALRGIYILTHASGTPGVLMRCAFPADVPEPWGYPESWASRAAKGFVYDGPLSLLDDPFNPGMKLPQMTFYTRVTRDQITGLVYGLSAYWNVVIADSFTDPADRLKIERSRQILVQIIGDVYRFLRACEFKIVDHTGRNDTNSDSVGKDLLRLAILSLYRQTSPFEGDPGHADRIQNNYEDLLRVIKTVGFFPSDPFNAASNATQYYAWNLRFTRAAALWLNADDADKPMISEYVRKWMFKFVKGHKNAWFTLVYAMTMQPPRDQSILDDGVLSLKSWALRPHVGWPSPIAKGWGRDVDLPNALERVSGAGDDLVLWPHLRKPTMYWTWQKDPWDVGITYPFPVFDGVGIDLTLPYWMGRYYGLL